MKSVSKFKHQVKSGKYYLFWGAATIAVMAGQIYVGTGYRNMARSIDSLIKSITYEPKGYYQPLVPPPTGFSQDPLATPYAEIDPDDYIIWLETE
tara:strand:- start:143 stop:427 length:285 start_codon:yes stop_codon:yes gene_type:complete